MLKESISEKLSMASWMVLLLSFSGSGTFRRYFGYLCSVSMAEKWAGDPLLLQPIWPSACLSVCPPPVSHFKGLFLITRCVGRSRRKDFLHRGKIFPRQTCALQTCALFLCLLPDWLLLSDAHHFFSASAPRIYSPKKRFILGEKQKLRVLARSSKNPE